MILLVKRKFIVNIMSLLKLYFRSVFPRKYSVLSGGGEAQDKVDLYVSGYVYLC